MKQSEKLSQNSGKFYGTNVLLALCIAALGVLFGIRSWKQRHPPYNVILVSVDTLRADHMGIYGYEKNTTPNTDRWAKGAYVFTNAVTAVPSTYASFVALMSGKHPFRTGEIRVEDSPLDPRTPTLATILASRGYETAAFVTNGWIGPSSNLSIGFDTQTFIDWNEYKDLQGTATVTREAYERTISQSIEWLERRQTRPFFLWVHLMDPHAPYNPPNDLQCVHNENSCDRIRATTPKDLEYLRASFEGWENGCATSQSLSTETVEMLETLYDGEITASDRLVGKILDAVRQKGLDKKTIVVLYADHGEGFDHSFYFDHGLLYQSNVRIALIMSLPQETSGTKIDRLVDATDVLPTTLDLLGISYGKDDFDGVSFRSLLDGEKRVGTTPSTVRQETYLIDADKRTFGIYDGRYKYLLTPSSEGACLPANQQEELYDTVKDPDETVNIIAEQPAVRDALRDDLLGKLDEHTVLDPRAGEGKILEADDLERLKSFGY